MLISVDFWKSMHEFAMDSRTRVAWEQSTMMKQGDSHVIFFPVYSAIMDPRNGLAVLHSGYFAFDRVQEMEKSGFCFVWHSPCFVDAGDFRHNFGWNSGGYVEVHTKVNVQS